MEDAKRTVLVVGHTGVGAPWPVLYEARQKL